MGERKPCASRCLAIPEIIYEVASHLQQDLLSASTCSRMWYETLIPLRSKFARVYSRDAVSFLEFLSSNARAVHNCQTLRIVPDERKSEDDDQEEDSGEEEDNEKVTNEPENTHGMSPISRILDLFSKGGRLKFFMYALPGESEMPLPEDVWVALRKLSKTLQGLHIELTENHWHTFLSSQYSNLQYLDLSLDTDEGFSSFDRSFDPKNALITFLHQLKNLQKLRLYLGIQFDGTNLSELYFPELQSLLLSSKTQGVKIKQFITKHTTLRSLDMYSESDIGPFAEHDLPNLAALQVSPSAIPWFQDVLAASSSRKQPIRHLQIAGAGPELNSANLQQLIAPLGKLLRCFELVFWNRNARLLSMLENVSRMFSGLVELSLLMLHEDDGQEAGAVDMGSILKCFATSESLLAISVSDPLAEPFSEEDVEAFAALLPSRLRYLVWKRDTFRIERKGHAIKAVRTQHPKSCRGNRYMRDWHEDMVFDHLKEDYGV
ncbi:hypothetical protein DFH11DRAFT_1084500 [Phellopilus nigrolimitatus]|nr:hypothetical protein DFH11DRAFT_1084500 [Phellopilus nigrolimitatus]